MNAAEKEQMEALIRHLKGVGELALKALPTGASWEQVASVAYIVLNPTPNTKPADIATVVSGLLCGLRVQLDRLEADNAKLRERLEDLAHELGRRKGA